MSDFSEKTLYVRCTYGSFLPKEYTDTLAYTCIPMGSLFENGGESGPRLKSNWVNATVLSRIFDDVDSFFHENDVALNNPAFLSRIQRGIFATNREVDGDQLLRNLHQFLIFSLPDNMGTRLSISALGTLLCSSYLSPECKGVVVQLRFHGRLAARFRDVFDKAPLVQNAIGMARLPYVNTPAWLTDNVIAALERQIRDDETVSVGRGVERETVVNIVDETEIPDPNDGRPSLSASLLQLARGIANRVIGVTPFPPISILHQPSSHSPISSLRGSPRHDSSGARQD